ncbi:MAG: hypothetical protein RMK29_21385 [Myxococcales bacterium]|nr:hypothetical protein [Myxococcota bacterium]MDW8284265.1 hypothetical protein [Myxococcales bacterium]
MATRSDSGLLLAATMLLCACPGPGPKPAQVAVQMDQSMRQGRAGYELALQAIGCWLGGLWAEAEGYLPKERHAATEVRCREVLRRAFGESRQRYVRLRQLDPALVDELGRKAGQMAGPEREEVFHLLRAVADAEREALEARRAASLIQRDLNQPQELTQLTWQEVQALSALRRSEALGRLLSTELGPHTDDARILGLLVAIDRVETVRTVPRYLAPYAIESVGKLLFGIDLPPEVEDPTRPLPPGAWLKYLCDVARAAGHPVPDWVQKPEDRGLLAFAGILKALAGRICQEEARLSKDAEPTLRRIVHAVARRLEQDYADASRAAAGRTGAPPPAPSQPSRST